MSGKEILVDTNIFLYLLGGNDTLENILQGKKIYLSFMTELELIGFKDMTPKEDKQIQSLLSDCLVLSLTPVVKEKYIAVRRKYHLKLADALIAATAIALGLPLITADKQFNTIKELQLVRYQI